MHTFLDVDYDKKSIADYFYQIMGITQNPRKSWPYTHVSTSVGGHPEISSIMNHLRARYSEDIFKFLNGGGFLCSCHGKSRARDLNMIDKSAILMFPVSNEIEATFYDVEIIRDEQGNVISPAANENLEEKIKYKILVKDKPVIIDGTKLHSISATSVEPSILYIIYSPGDVNYSMLVRE